MPRILTWNIRKAVGLDWRRDPLRILHVLSAAKVDIAILQEADRRLRPRAPALPPQLLADRGWTVVPTDPDTPSIGHHGNAILVRNGWRANAVHRIDLPGLEPRGALAVVLDGPYPLSVVGAHLALRRRDRVSQCAALGPVLRHIGPSALLAGDLNEWRRAGLPLPDNWAWHLPPPTFHAAWPRLVLDRVAVGPGLRVAELGVLRSAQARIASDHLPVAMSVDRR